MKNDLKKQIIDAFNDEASADYLNNIKAKCSMIEQIEPVDNKKPSFINLKRIILASSMAILLFVGIAIGAFLPNISRYSNVSVFLDVNPSVEIQLDNKDRVYDCIANNSDAEIILSDMNLEGVELNTAVNAIVGSMYVNGYLTDEANSILVGVNNNDNDLVANVTNEINDIFKKNNSINCSIVGHSFKMDKDMKNKAKEWGISVSKMHLVDEIIKHNDRFSDQDFDVLSNMSIKELNLMYSNNAQNMPNKDDVILGKPQGFINRDDALDIVLNTLKINRSNINNLTILEDYNRDNYGPKRMLYLVMFTYNNSECSYLVDCITGEVLQGTIPPRR